MIPQKHIDAEIYLGVNRILAEAIERIKALGEPQAISSRLEYPSDICGVLLDYINPPDVIEEEVEAYHDTGSGPDPDWIRDCREDEKMMARNGAL